MKRVIWTILLIVGSYLLLYGLEFLFKLLFLAPPALDREQRETIRRLDEEKSGLKARPYEQSLATTVRTKLDGTSQEAKALLKFLLEHGETEQAQLLVPGVRNDKKAEILTECQSLALIKERKDRIENVGLYTYWRLTENFQEPLKDLLYAINS